MCVRERWYKLSTPPTPLVFIELDFPGEQSRVAIRGKYVVHLPCCTYTHRASPPLLVLRWTKNQKCRCFFKSHRPFFVSFGTSVPPLAFKHASSIANGTSKF